jgi:hypothetical protein
VLEGSLLKPSLVGAKNREWPRAFQRFDETGGFDSGNQSCVVGGVGCIFDEIFRRIHFLSQTTGLFIPAKAAMANAITATAAKLLRLTSESFRGLGLSSAKIERAGEPCRTPALLSRVAFLGSAVEDSTQ